MFPSKQFFAQLCRHEGFYSEPYVCPAGAATIGYGTNLEAYPAYIPFEKLRAGAESGKLKGRPLVKELIKNNMYWTRADADAAMRAEVDLCITQLERRCPAFTCLLALERGRASSAGAVNSTGGMASLATAPAAKEELSTVQVRAEALINMCFNMGIGNEPDQGRKVPGRGLLSFVNTLALIERGEFGAASSNMLQSKWAAQVKSRAVELAEQIKTGEYQR